jgi:hypothetical protein
MKTAFKRNKSRPNGRKTPLFRPVSTVFSALKGRSPQHKRPPFARQSAMFHNAKSHVSPQKRPFSASPPPYFSKDNAHSQFDKMTQFGQNLRLAYGNNDNCIANKPIPSILREKTGIIILFRTLFSLYLHIRKH